MFSKTIINSLVGLRSLSSPGLVKFGSLSWFLRFGLVWFPVLVWFGFLVLGLVLSSFGLVILKELIEDYYLTLKLSIYYK